ncbi:L,D-transpeptidase [Parasedimentitalea psychrophila]|uniref:L,D-transpeptidase n=1 Tax=Parasedimentitalea psychrophila TaxID=2997337 RepID=A0A9Y2KVS1_9RHOB|nr:L,D-transpeptidase [Parasedimentitalea psychrophila]WIY23578.1 L,D-transpeptidase [Parasedimentitalea psychrophila]
MSNTPVTRRYALMGAAATLMTPSILRAQSVDAFPADESPIEQVVPVKRNISAFQKQQWQDHFETLGVGCLLADISSRAVHYWGGDEVTYRLFPSSVPITEELTRRGYSKVVRKAQNPSWTPTASMRERDPSLPLRMEGGAGNPLGTRAMYLDWPAYLVHGTHDTRKIGRQSSSGCIGLYNQHVEDLYELVQVGTQVRLL